jgi:hypothetical protein
MQDILAQQVLATENFLHYVFKKYTQDLAIGARKDGTAERRTKACRDSGPWHSF